MMEADPRLTLDLTKATDVELTYRGLCQSTWLQTLKAERERMQMELEVQDETIRRVGRDLEHTVSELQSRTGSDGQKYHDIGHARTLFESKLVDGKRIPLAEEELDPTVRAYLKRRALFEE